MAGAGDGRAARWKEPGLRFIAWGRERVLA